MRMYSKKYSVFISPHEKSRFKRPNIEDFYVVFMVLKIMENFLQSKKTPNDITAKNKLEKITNF